MNQRLNELLYIAKSGKMTAVQKKELTEHFYKALEEVRTVENTRTYLCPWHEEKTPSFTINLDKNTFHCFGCGIEGEMVIKVKPDAVDPAVEAFVDKLNS